MSNIPALVDTILRETCEARNDIRELNNSQRLTAAKRLALLDRLFKISDAAYAIHTNYWRDVP